MKNIFNITIWNLSGVSGYPGPLDGGEVGDGTDFFQHGSYCKLSPRGNSYRRSCRCSFSRSGGRRDNLKRTLLKYQKWGGNDGEPDASQKLEFEKNDKNWLESKNCGRFGIRIENIQSDSSKEVRGQS